MVEANNALPQVFFLTNIMERRLLCYFSQTSGLPYLSSIPNHCSAFIWALFFALSMFFTEQRDNFQISCHLIGWKKSLSVRLFWKLSHLQNNSLWDQISIDGEPSYCIKTLSHFIWVCFLFSGQSFCCLYLVFFNYGISKWWQNW